MSSSRGNVIATKDRVFAPNGITLNKGTVSRRLARSRHGMIIEFTVNYGLDEYLSIVGDYTVALTRKKELEKYPDKKPSESYPFTIFLFRFFASIAFFIKKRRMPESAFVIDEDQILRKTKHGTLIIKWTEIIELHESLDGFILIKQRGGLPIPFRCLTESEKIWIKDRYDRGRRLTGRYVS